MTGDHRSMWDYRVRNDHLDILKGMGLSKKKNTFYLIFSSKINLSVFLFFFLPFVFLIYDDGDLRLKEIKLALILKINAA